MNKVLRYFGTICSGFLVMMLQCGLVNAQDRANDESGVIDVSPGPGFVIEPSAMTFNFALKYTPGTKGVQAGTYLEIIPFVHRPYAVPQIHLQTKARPKKTHIVLDQFYTSRSVLQRGAPVRVLVILLDGLEEGEHLTFNYQITRHTTADYGREEPCQVAFSVNLRDSDGGLIKEFSTPSWRIATYPPVEMKLILPSQAKVGAEVDLLVSFTNDWGRPTYDEIGQVILVQPDSAAIADKIISLKPEDRGVKLVKVKFGKAGIYRVSGKADMGLQSVSNPILVRDHDGLNLYWGNLHSHTYYSWDTRNLGTLNCRSPAGEAVFARDSAGLDFISVTDHGQHGSSVNDVRDWRIPTNDMPLEDWERYQQLVISSEYPNIIAYFGYEHRDPRGDTCMVFRHKGTYFIENEKRLDVKEVWNRNAHGQLLSIPHFHPLAGLDHFDSISSHEKLAEVYSAHGAYEYFGNPQPDLVPYSRNFKGHASQGPFVQDLLSIGIRLGFCASSDHGAVGMWGLTAVAASKKDRDSIFDNLLARHTYASTGARMLISFNTGALGIGDEMAVKKSDPEHSLRIFSLEVHGTSPIKSIELIRNNDVIHAKHFENEILNWKEVVTDNKDLGAVALERKFGRHRTAYYYLRVSQIDGHIAWASPIFFLLDEK